MLTGASYLAVVLYLVPLAVLLAVRARPDRDAWEVALDIPFGIALDLLGVLTLSLVMRLELATLVSRAAWIAGGVVYVVWRRKRGLEPPRRPRSMGRRELALVVMSACAGAALSMEISRACLNSDRRWHVPLVTSLRGQTLPFHNVYDPHGVLAYHYSGDVIAAQLQALSFGILHSSFALSLAHDLLFGLTAATIALLMRQGGIRRIPFGVLAALGLLLAGPITLLRPDGQAAGYDFVDFLRLSYRPHIALGGLLIAGFLGAIWARLRDPDRTVPAASTWPVLVALTGALALTDEASIGLLGVATFGAWLVDQNALARHRMHGVAILAALLAALVVSTLVFHGALSPGAPRENIDVVAWQAPGYHHGALSLDIVKGRRMLGYDLLATGLVWLAGVLVVVSSRRRRDLAMLILFTLLACTSVLALTRIVIGGVAEESHRFMTALMLAVPLVGLFWVVRARAPGVARTMGAIVPCLAISAIALSAASTLRWMQMVGTSSACDKPTALFTTADFNEVDCRDSFAAHLGESTMPTYLARPVAYLYSGCHPVFAASARQPGQHWMVNTGMPIFGRGALAVLDGWLGPERTLGAACSVRPDWDPVCTYARAQRRCRAVGGGVAVCYLTAADRAQILSNASNMADR